jgi:hypothetical protein
MSYYFESKVERDWQTPKNPFFLLIRELVPNILHE